MKRELDPAQLSDSHLGAEWDNYGYAQKVWEALSDVQRDQIRQLQQLLQEGKLDPDLESRVELWKKELGLE